MRILIANIHMKPGGNRSSLLNLLSNLDLESNQVDLFLFVHDEKTREDISKIKGVRLLEESLPLSMFYTPFKTYSEQKDLPKMAMKKAVSFAARAFGTRRTLLFLMLFQEKFSGYDAAVSFAHDKWVGGFYGGSNDFVRRKVEAGRKIGWVHNDPYRLAFTREICERTYRSFDCIVHVSNACKEKFDEICPKYRERSMVVYNTFNSEEIRRLAEEKDPYDDKGFRIVTVARMFNLQKRIDRIIECCRRLRAEGIKDFRWHVVGDGPDMARLIQKAESESLGEILVFEGHKDNPYPYMRHADVFVLTSRYEAQGMVVTESLITGTPVIVTDYEEAFEFVENGRNGIITMNSTDGVHAAVRDVLLNRGKLESMRECISRQSFDNSKAVKQFWSALQANQQ
jgi:glycosyltransferase involved in cell wall biosynthesis